MPTACKSTLSLFFDKRLVQQLWCYWQVPGGESFVGSAAVDRMREHAPVLKKVTTMFLSHPACCCITPFPPFHMLNISMWCGLVNELHAGVLQLRHADYDLRACFDAWYCCSHWHVILQRPHSMHASLHG